MSVATRLAAAAPATPLLRRWCLERGSNGFAPLSSQAGSDDGEGKRRSSSNSKVVAVVERIRLAYEYLSQRRLPQAVRASRGDSVRNELDSANVVEQRIIESMGEGHFENLPGKGKPLRWEAESENPHCDPDEVVLNRVLAKNGFAPRWVELREDIRCRALKWRLTLRFALEKRDEVERQRVDAFVEGLRSELKDINRQVLDYNIMAPFGHQIISYNFERELNIAFRQIQATPASAEKERPAQTSSSKEDMVLVSKHLL